MKPEEKQDGIVRAALEIMDRSGNGNGPEISFDQALKVIEVEQIWRIASITHQLRIAVDDLTEEITEDISGSLELTHKRLNEIDQTLYDTLGSGKAGVALDAIAELPTVIKDR